MTKNYKINRNIKINEVVKIKAPIVEALQKSVDNPTYQFHIPGHTKGRAVFSDFKKLIGEKALNVDTTDEFDNLGTLHPATGAIKRAQKLAQEAFNSQRTFFLTGGSTIGNLAIALGATKPNSQILIGRNCHRRWHILCSNAGNGSCTYRSCHRFFKTCSMAIVWTAYWF